MSRHEDETDREQWSMPTEMQQVQLQAQVTQMLSLRPGPSGFGIWEVGR